MSARFVLPIHGDERRPGSGVRPTPEREFAVFAATAGEVWLEIGASARIDGFRRGAGAPQAGQLALRFNAAARPAWAGEASASRRGGGHTWLRPPRLAA